MKEKNTLVHSADPERNTTWPTASSGHLPGSRLGWAQVIGAGAAVFLLTGAGSIVAGLFGSVAGSPYHVIAGLLCGIVGLLIFILLKIR